MWVTKTFDKESPEFVDANGEKKKWGIPYELFEKEKDPKQRMDALCDFFGIDVCTHNVVSQILVQVRAKMGSIIEKNPDITNEELLKQMHDDKGNLYKPAIQSAKKTKEQKLMELVEEQRKNLPQEAFHQWLETTYGVKVAGFTPANGESTVDFEETEDDYAEDTVSVEPEMASEDAEEAPLEEDYKL